MQIIQNAAIFFVENKNSHLHASFELNWKMCTFIKIYDLAQLKWSTLLRRWVALQLFRTSSAKIQIEKIYIFKTTDCVSWKWKFLHFFPIWGQTFNLHFCIFVVGIFFDIVHILHVKASCTCERNARHNFLLYTRRAGR